MREPQKWQLKVRLSLCDWGYGVVSAGQIAQSAFRTFVGRSQVSINDQCLFLQETDRMSRFPTRSASRYAVTAALFASCGCMYQQPMYQPAPYGQQMYGAPGGYVQPGTMVIPPSNAAPYQPGATGTYDPNTRPDDFRAEPGSGAGSGTSDGRFFGEDPVPAPKDSGAGTGDDKFNREFGSGT